MSSRDYFYRSGSTAPTPPIPPVNRRNWQSAFCIPDALPGIPYGDNRRIWTPAFGCYTPEWQRTILLALQARSYTAVEYLMSGWPYRQDYPYLTRDVDRIVADLTLIKEAGLITIVAFDDGLGPNLFYLQPIANATQGLVDRVMGIYEVNGVFNNDYAIVEDVLRQSRALYPNAALDLHLTPQDEGMVGFGGVGFWQRCTQPDIRLDAYLWQTQGWRDTQGSIARCADFTRRLMGGMNGYPILPDGVYAFELSTTKTYNHQWTEEEGIALTNAVMTAPPTSDGSVLSQTPTGFCDGGSIR